MSEIAIRRLLVRSRRRRPSWWALLTGCWLLITLAHVGIAVLRVFAGEWWQILLAIFWVCMYVVWRGLRDVVVREERAGLIGRPWPGQWVLLAINASFLFVWQGS